MEKGIYTLVLRTKEERMIYVGSLGPVIFAGGYYAYTGSARGPAGLKRLERHIRIMNGQNTTRKWHIDYLLPLANLQESIITFTDRNLECFIAGQIGAQLASIRNFGSTDCCCSSHLHYSIDLDEISCIVRQAHRECTRIL